MILDLISSANKEFQFLWRLRGDGDALQSHYSSMFNGYLSDSTGIFSNVCNCRGAVDLCWMVHGCLPARRTSGYKMCFEQEISAINASVSGGTVSKCSRNPKWMKTSVTVKLFFPSVDKKANAGTTAVTVDVRSLPTVIEKHDETSGRNSRTKISHQHEPSVQHHSPDSVSAFTSRCLRQSTAELFKPFIVSLTSTSDPPPPE